MSELREGSIHRKTEETEVSVRLLIDGSGRGDVSTGIGFFDHMLELFARHGGFDLFVEASGDTEVDFHHTVEDVGICLGRAFAEAVGEKEGIERFGEASIVLDETVSRVVLDVSGRAFFKLHGDLVSLRAGDFDVYMVEDFLRAFCHNAFITMHVFVEDGLNPHHVAETVFKAFAVALRRALVRGGRRTDVPSTKGVL